MYKSRFYVQTKVTLDKLRPTKLLALYATKPCTDQTPIQFDWFKLLTLKQQPAPLEEGHPFVCTAYLHSTHWWKSHCICKCPKRFLLLFSAQEAIRRIELFGGIVTSRVFRPIFLLILEVVSLQLSSRLPGNRWPLDLLYLIFSFNCLTRVSPYSQDMFECNAPDAVVFSTNCWWSLPYGNSGKLIKGPFFDCWCNSTCTKLNLPYPKGPKSITHASFGG